jgi:hypothetical protein
VKVTREGRTAPILTAIFPFTRLGSGGDGSGDNVLHDDGTWGPAEGTVPDGTDPGDILVWDGDSWEVLPIGGDDEVLTADSGETLGVKWATPATGSFTQSYVGYNTVGASNEAPANKKVLAKQITTSGACELLSIGCHLKANTGTPGVLMWGVWEDNSGVPRTLMMADGSETASFLFTPGSDRYRWADFPVGLHLAASTSYWIGFMFDGTYQVHYDTSGSDHSITSGGWWIPDWDFYSDSDTTKKYSIRGNIIE